MSLYDDIDTDKMESSTKKPTETVPAWASGMKFMQTHMQLKKKNLPQPKKEVRRQQLAPVVDFKQKNANNNNNGNNNGNGDNKTTTKSSGPSFILPYTVSQTKGKGRGGIKSSFSFVAIDPEWQFDNEYDPYFPNDYDRALRDLRDRRDKEAEEEETKRRAEGYVEPHADDSEYRVKEEKTGGVTIAPPPSLNIDYDDDQPFSMADVVGKGSSSTTFSSSNNKFGGSVTTTGTSAPGGSAAAKIMAKYGYKEGQGLGRLEQGMSTALKVEKTSHRIGRIIHEKDLPKEGVVNLLGTPLLAASYLDDDEFEMEPPPPTTQQSVKQEPAEDENATNVQSQIEKDAEEQLKNPSKVVLLTNMVGPADVDDDLEPEVKEECQKYGEVVAVIVFQMPDVDGDDSIRIFVEFTQVTSAVKAFMDLNGRYFGGRQVRASFYDPEKFNNLELTC